MATASITQKVGDYEIDLDPDKSLGTGALGQVFVGRHARSGKDIAAKRLECHRDFVTEMDHEANLMKTIPLHINVLKLFDYIKKDIDGNNNVQGWLILELCTLGNVREFAEKKALSIVQKVDLILQGSQGVQHLHSQKPSIIHHDIKLENLLVTGSEYNPVVKVGDFGISKFFAHSRDQSVTKRVREGTEPYLAPELYRLGKNNKSEFNKAVDVFAMAIGALTLVEEQHGERMWTYKVVVGKEKKGLGRHIHEKRITNVAALIKKSGDSEEVKRFKTIIASMLAKDAQKRPTIHGVVDRLTQLRSELGIQKRNLEYQLDTVWTPAILQVNRVRLRTAESRAQIKEKIDQLTHMLLEEEQEIRDNTLLVVDPYKQNTLWIHDVVKWVRFDAPDECQWRGACVGRVSNGLVVTGVRMQSPYESSPCYHFSLSTREWKRLQDMITPRVLASAVEMADMKLIMAGGRVSAVTHSRACEVLDVRRGEWSSASPLPDGMTGDVVLGAVGGRAYTLGKTTNSGVRFLQYDPEFDTHTTKPSPPVTLDTSRRICVIATLAGVTGKILLVCRDVDDSCKALKYDPSTQQWHQLEPPTTYLPPRISDLTIGKDARILLCGTSRTVEEDERNLIEEYCIYTQNWRVLDIRLPFLAETW